MPKLIHAGFDVDAILHRGLAHQLAGHIRRIRRDGPGEPWMSVEEVATYALCLKLRGYRLMPTCGHYDRQGYCLGHDEPDDTGQPTRRTAGDSR